MSPKRERKLLNKLEALEEKRAVVEAVIRRLQYGWHSCRRSGRISERPRVASSSESSSKSKTTDVTYAGIDTR